MLLDPQNGEAFDLPRPSLPGRTWVLASLPRTGSTFLCRVLTATGGVGAPKEYLNPMQLRDWEARLSPGTFGRVRHRLLPRAAVALAGRGRWTRDRFVSYLERVRERRTDPSGWFGIKIHYHHFEAWFLDCGWPVERDLAPERWIYLRRADRVAQAVSWSRALQSGRWAAHQRPLLPAYYRPRQIDRLLGEIERHEAGWERYFAEQGIAPLRLTYETVARDIEGAVRRVLGFLAVPGAARIVPAPPDLLRQADARSGLWIERFRGERVAGGDPGPAAKRVPVRLPAPGEGS
jgi:trehalose 2-sulfotransferase